MLKKIRETIRNNFNIRLKTYLSVHCQMVPGNQVLMGIAPINFKCYYNSVQRAKEDPTLEVWCCVYWDVAYVLHFMNRDQDGNFIENTLGYLKDENTYYLLRKVMPAEYEHIASIFDYQLDYFNNHFMTWWERLLLGSARVI